MCAGTVKFALDSGVTNQKLQKRIIRLGCLLQRIHCRLIRPHTVLLSLPTQYQVSVSPIVPGASSQYKVQAQVGGAGALNEQIPSDFPCGHNASSLSPLIS